MKKIKVIVYGCGVMGRKMAEALLEKKSFELVGALDINTQLVGKDLGEFLASKKKLGIIIGNDPKALFSRVKAQAVIHTTTSGLKSVYPQISQCLKAGLNVISTCEELSYPWKRYPKLSRDLDQLAQKCGATVVGTGINPGYLMDTLPLVLTTPCLKVDTVKVTRMMNSARRRIPFQAKVGTGLTAKEFRKKIDDKIITGHVGLLESINMIAAGLGWTLDEAVEIPPKPVIAKKPVKTALGVVTPGKVIGLVSLAYAKKNGKKVITLEFCANAGVRKEYDEIIIEGHPRIHEKIHGGVHGDVGTVAVTLNTIPRAVEAPAGLKAMKDLPPATATP
jgi:4-hydroxy-tetrahydrodipicolinate reductase